MKWYNIDIPYITSSDIKKADHFKIYMDNHNIKHEISSNKNMIHIEILLRSEEIDIINNALDRIVFYDSITEV